MTTTTTKNSWTRTLPVWAVALLISMPNDATGQNQLRGEVEQELVPIEAAYRAAPGDDEARRAYADILFKLGNIWQANDVIAPLATPSSSTIADLELGAKLALLTSDYERADALYGRMRAVTTEGSEEHTTALEGLVMVYYQTNDYAMAKSIALPGQDEPRGIGTMLTFMQRFEGTPNQIEWATPDRVAHLPIVNDFAPGGALPLMKLEINGHTVEFILDTGGDRLYIDESVAQQVGIRNIANRRSRYAYTKGEYVDEPLGVADVVTMGDVTLRNVPVVVAKWKAMGPTSDGVVTTQMLKPFLSTVDYDNRRITFRERSERGMRQLMDSFGGKTPIRMPFFMTGTHLMYTKGNLNGHQGINYFMDSGLGMSMPIVIIEETVEFLGLDKNPVAGTQYYWSSLESHGIGGITRGATQALGNVIVEENPYWRLGFLFDALMSHQYLRHLGSWTIDFDAMSYYFPAQAPAEAEVAAAPATTSQVEVENPETYVGSYEVAPGVALAITADGGSLFLQAPGQQKVGLVAAEDGTFSIPLAGAIVVFERDGSGAITGLVLDQSGNETRAAKK